MWKHTRYHFFDSGSYTPLCREAHKAVKEVLQKQQCIQSTHPSSAHTLGRDAEQYVIEAKKLIAEVGKIKPEAVVSTSGATEANDLAFTIAIDRAEKRGIALRDMQIVTSAEEHPSYITSLERLKKRGIQIIYVKKKGGYIAVKEVKEALRKGTVLVSFAYAVSTHGRLREISTVMKEVKKTHPEVMTHTDATQTAGYLSCSPEALSVDMVTIDSAKVYGPQGTGALLVHTPLLTYRQDGEAVRLGTPSVALLYGFAKALQETEKKRKVHKEIVEDLRLFLVEHLEKITPEVYVFGIEKTLHEVKKKDWQLLAPHLLYLSFPQTHHAYLATLLDTEGYAVSTGTACSGLKGDALRIGLLPRTTKREIKGFVEALRKTLPLAHTL